MREMKLNPSSAAWAVGGNVISGSDKGCLRNLVFSAYVDKYEEIDPKYALMGAEGEDLYEQYLREEQPWPYHKEFVLRDEFFGAKRSGRVDFLTHHDGYRVVHECKSSQSYFVYKEVFEAGTPKIDHLAQLVFYLIMLRETRGRLVYRFFPKKGPKELKSFKIQVCSEGGIWVDGTRHQFSVANQLEHQLMAAKTITELGVVVKAGSSACKYCKVKQLCSDYDSVGGTIKHFLETLPW